ncbi:MAG: PIN domain-containing protein [Bdellovibrionota bacterium]
MAKSSFKNLVLVDTSVFIDYLRGDTDNSLAVLILQNQVLLSPIVRLELLSGVSKKDLPALEKLCGALQQLEAFASPNECEKLLKLAKGTGLFGGIPDLLIIADAIKYKLVLFTYDKKMEKLAKRLGAKTLTGGLL